MLFDRLLSSEIVLILRYSVVGIVNTLLGYGLIVVAMAVGMNPFAANAIGFSVGLAVSFILNSRWTFGGNRQGIQAAMSFGLAFAFAYSLNAYILYVMLNNGWQPHYAQAFAILSYQVVFFALLRIFVFRASDFRAISFTAISAPRRRLILHALLVGSAVLPFLAFGAAAGLIDAPNAIGRIGIGMRLVADPESSRFYTLSIKVIPNMAVDLWGLAIGRLVGAETAVNWFVALSIVVFYVAVQTLRKVLFQQGSVVIGAFSIFAIYSLALRWGFMNYVFASGLMIFAIARLEAYCQRTASHFAYTQAALLALTFLSSIFPVILYFLYAATRLAPSVLTYAARREIPKCIHLVGTHSVGAVVVLLLLFFGQTAPPWQQDTNWLLESKLEGILALFRYYDEPIEISVAVLSGMSALLLASAFRPKLSAGHAASLLVLVGAFIAMPFLLKGVAFADSRLPGTIMGLSLGLVQIADKHSSWLTARQIKALIGISIVAALAKPWAAENQMSPALSIARSIPQLFEGISDGSVFTIIVLERDADQSEHFHLHLPLLELMHRDVFFPEVFKNYFIDFRPIAELPADRSDKIGLAASLLCSNATHVAAFGANPQAAELQFIHILRSYGTLSVGEINRKAISTPMPAC